MYTYRKRKRMRRYGACICGLSVLLLLSGCQTKKNTDSTKSEASVRQDEASETRDIFAMDTYMTLTAYGDHAGEAVDAAVDEIERLDALLSVSDQDGEIYTLNQNGSEIVSEDTAELIERSLAFYKSTDGLFDITVYPLMDAWGFTTEKYRVPSQKEIRKLLQRVDASKVSYDAKTRMVTLPDDMEIDLGGIAKGYTSGRVMDIFRQHGVTSGIVSLGGNVHLCGAKTDGSLWKVAIENPDKSDNYIGVVSAKDKAVITSGGYERYFEQDGKRWHHILDPRTGWPAESGLSSVSIVSGDGTLADALSTSLFIMGKEDAISYWKKHADSFDVILVEGDGSITITQGLQDSFQSDNPYTVVTE